MKLLVMTPTRVPGPEFVESLKLLGLDWVQDGVPLMRIYSQYGFTHVLYTSCVHSFITWDVGSIHAAYSFGGPPRCLVSADKDIDPPEFKPRQSKTHRLIYRYPNTKAFIGEIPFVAERLHRLRAGELNKWDYRDGVKLDHQCEIFHNLGNDGRKDLVWDSREGYFFNKVTRSNPCVLNFNGGAPGISRLFKRWRRQHRKNMIRKTLALYPRD